VQGVVAILRVVGSLAADGTAQALDELLGEAVACAVGVRRGYPQATALAQRASSSGPIDVVDAQAVVTGHSRGPLVPSAAVGHRSEFPEFVGVHAPVIATKPLEIKITIG
jgi:hypothetical protein